MVMTFACLGLRVSELLGLQWGDVDFENLTVKLQRSVVEGKVNPTKSEASESTLPLDPDLSGALLAHKASSKYVADSDFVFAGDEGKPRWKDGLLADYLKPAAARAGTGSRCSRQTLEDIGGRYPARTDDLLLVRQTL